MELLVSLVDKGDTVDALKTGEVVCIMPDGHPWSDIELTHPNAQIISAPILNSHAQALMAPHTILSNQVKGVEYPNKAYLLDLTKLPNSQHFKSGRRILSKIVMQGTDVENASVKVN